MAKYVSIIERRVATTKGTTLLFKPMEPLEVPEIIVPEVLAAGIVREDLFKAAMSGQLKANDEALVAASLRAQAVEGGITADEEPVISEEDAFDTIAAELALHKQEEQEKDEAVRLAELEAAADAEAEASREARGTSKEEDAAFLESEKSPVFDQAVFEAGVRELIAKNDPATLTPKGAPKAKVLSDLVGFEVHAIQITNFLKNLE